MKDTTQLLLKGGITQMYRILDAKGRITFVASLPSEDFEVFGQPMVNSLGKRGYEVSLTGHQFFVYADDAILVDPANVLASSLLADSPGYVYLEGDNYDTFLEACAQHSTGDVHNFIYTGWCIEPHVQWTFIVQECLLVRHQA